MRKLLAFLLACALCLSAAKALAWEDYNTPTIGATWLWQAEDQRMLVCCHLQDLVMVFTAEEEASLPSPSLFTEILGTLTMPGFEPIPAPSEETAP